RRRLAGPGWSRHENETARLLGHLRNHVRQSEICERPNVERNLTNEHRHAATLLEAVTAEPREVLDAEREVELVLHLEPLFLILRQHGVRELQRVLRREDVLERRIRE